MKTSPDSPWDKPPPSSFLFCAWLEANQHVPFPSVYRIDALPKTGPSATALEKLSRLEFLYRITNSFVADLTHLEGKILPVALRPASFAYRLMPIQGHEDLMPPEDALKILEAFLQKQSPAFGAALARELKLPAEKNPGIVKNFRRAPWHSLRLEQPFSAGVIEPIYKFRKAPRPRRILGRRPHRPGPPRVRSTPRLIFLRSSSP